ncbi:MAG: GGDEF domain-containing protein [Spirochaetales bacterium]|nr:GGDEF domain-containing protein [Spirochaetales bacterium]
MRHCLYFLDMKIKLKHDVEYIIGRDTQALIRIPGQTISRKHARIISRNGRFLIEDTNSMNGLFVNGKKTLTHVLFDGDHITIGTCYLVYKEFGDATFEEEFDRELTDTLLIEHQMAELLQSVSDKKAHKQLLNLKRTVNKAKTKLHALANRDRLTRLYNRRYLDEELAKELERAKRYKYMLSFLLIDIDHFKQVNDVQGHQMSDRVLTSIASIIRKNTRVNDLVARYGGEEIAVVIPEMKSDMSIKIAEKIRCTIETDMPKCMGLSVTVSIGVGFYSPGEKAEQLITKADKSLYEAKKRGRNMVVIYNRSSS